MATLRPGGRRRPGRYGRAMAGTVPTRGRAPDLETTGSGGTRARIAASAFELFATQGYDATTVEAIAESAGVARRTFFRYFPSKDDVILPDHESLLISVREFLAAADGLEPVVAVCGGVRLVFRSYVAEPDVSVQRYRLIRRVAALRQREVVTVSQYERAFSGYLRERLPQIPGQPDAALRAEVIAAAVVAAHNTVLREWLRQGGTAGQGEALRALDDALDFVTRTTEPAAQGEEPTGGPAGDAVAGDGTVVAVFRTPEGFDNVVHRLRRQLGEEDQIPPEDQ